MFQCCGITLKGKRCKKMAKKGLYCHIHFKILSNMDPDVIELLNMTKKSLSLNPIWAIQLKYDAVEEPDESCVYEGDDIRPQDKYRTNALISASGAGDYKSAKMLVDFGVAIQYSNDNKWYLNSSALFRAVCEKHNNIIKMLIDSGRADLNVKCYNGTTPLIQASIDGSVEAVKMLIKAGADLDAQNNHECTAIMNCSYEEHASISKLLLDAGADISIENKHGDTILSWVSRYGSVSFLQMLIESGANMEGTAGGNALFCAVKFRCFNMAKILVESGANANFQCGKGINSEHTPLMYACIHGNLEFVKILLAYGADPNVQNSLGDVALRYAHGDQRDKITKILLDFGADVNLKNNEGDSSYSLNV